MRKVIALKRGFHESLREVGDVFMVHDDCRASWFIDVESEPESEAEPKQRRPRKPRQEPGELA